MALPFGGKLRAGAGYVPNKSPWGDGPTPPPPVSALPGQPAPTFVQPSGMVGGTAPTTRPVNGQISSLADEIRAGANAGEDPQAAELRNLLAQLRRGEGINVGPMNNDPEAQAFRAARLRESEQSRGEEAARLSASGVSGSGDFDASVSRIRENAGTDIAGFEAALTGRRRKEATDAAITGATATLADLDRARMDKAGRVASLQQLMNSLIAQEQGGVDTQFRLQDEARRQEDAARERAAFNESELGKKLITQQTRAYF